MSIPNLDRRRRLGDLSNQQLDDLYRRFAALCEASPEVRRTWTFEGYARLTERARWAVETEALGGAVVPAADAASWRWDMQHGFVLHGAVIVACIVLLALTLWFAIGYVA